MKGTQEKESIMGVRGRLENSTLGITVWYLFGKPCDARQWPSGQVFLSTPHTHDRFLYTLVYTGT